MLLPAENDLERTGVTDPGEDIVCLLHMVQREWVTMDAADRRPAASMHGSSFIALGYGGPGYRLCTGDQPIGHRNGPVCPREPGRKQPGWS